VQDDPWKVEHDVLVIVCAHDRIDPHEQPVQDRAFSAESPGWPIITAVDQ
jgi:hypothetical protein